MTSRPFPVEEMEMVSTKRVQYHDIPLIIDGKAKIVKSVTRLTTCADVINTLPKTEFPLAIFQSVNGEEKELLGKTKLLKVWRSNGSSKKVKLVVKRSEGLKERRLSLNIFSSRNSRKDVNSDFAKEKLKQVSDLAFYVQYQKSKLRKITTQETQDRRSLQKVKSTSSMDSMDAFLAKADLEKMGQFLDFCSGVTASHLGGTPKAKQELVKPSSRISRSTIRDSLKTMKLGFKRTLTSKVSFASKTTSASTIKSTDTGYQSVGSGTCKDSSAEPQPQNHHVFNDHIPVHSTPVSCETKNRMKKQTLDDTLDVTLTPKAVLFDEDEGKSVLMRRFMADTTICEATRWNCKTSQRREEANKKLARNTCMYASAPVLFRSQEEKCRFYWDKNCDSDSDTSCSDICNDSCEGSTDLDEAFVEECIENDSNIGNSSVDGLSNPTPRKMRRESAVSNLNMFESGPKTFESTYFDEEPEDNGFNYSFDCSFQDFSDSQEFSIDYSCSETESDTSSSFEENSITRVKESDFYSFMTSRESLKINEISQFVSSDCGDKQSEIGSDEGVGSMASVSFSEEQEFFI